LKTSQEPEIAAQRVSTVDILCQDTEGAHFIVEIQIAHESGFTKRAQYYAAKTYIEQREKGIEYIDLKQVIFLAITNFTIFPEKKEYLSHHAMLDQHTQEHDLKDFSFSFLELPKFKKKKSELKSMTEKWSYFLKYAPETEEQDLPLIVGNDTIILRAFNELNRYAWSVEDMRTYDSIDRKQCADRDILNTAKAEAIAEEKRLIARAMLNKKIAISLIAEITGLTEMEIKAPPHA
jgi:predicted transposase/invertase (TIGR01784 family)